MIFSPVSNLTNHPLEKIILLYFRRNIKILPSIQKFFFEIIVQTALVMGGFWTIQKITPIIITVLNYTVVSGGLWSFLTQEHKLRRIRKIS